MVDINCFSFFTSDKEQYLYILLLNVQSDVKVLSILEPTWL